MTEKSAEKRLQSEVDKQTEQGFVGTKVDPLPNSAHSLESGPDSPSAAEQYASALAQRAEQANADAKEKQ